MRLSDQKSRIFSYYKTMILVFDVMGIGQHYNHKIGAGLDLNRTTPKLVDGEAIHE